MAEFIDACQPWLTGTGTLAPPPWQPEEFDAAAFAAVAPLAQTRIAVLSEIVPNVDFLFLASPLIEEAAWTKTMKDGSAELLDAAVVAFEALESWDAESLKSTLEAVGAERGLKLGKTQAPVRVAVTGRTVGLPLFESLEVLGREHTLTRCAPPGSA